ncbi:MAG: ABC transporter substrate-binding protein [Prevotellaceae bacterium]|nr:ABC transporter substrate-binding protein [Prevotellaceae bacterium]
MKCLFRIIVLLFALPVLAQVRVGVFLPFKSGGAVGSSAVEYYRGLLMAVDSLSQDNRKYTIVAAHSGQTAADMQALLNETKNGVFDIIFAPSNQEQLRVLDTYSKRNGTKVVVPFGGAYDDFIANRAFYALRVTQTDFTPAAYQLLTSALKGKTLYVVSTNGGTQICPFANYVSKYVKGAKTLEYPKQEKKIMQLMGDADAVIIPSMYDEQTQATLVSLAAKTGGVKAAVVGYPAWYDRAVNESARRELCSLNAYIIQQHFPRTNLPRVKKFAALYKQNFDKELPQERFNLSMWGFDTGYFLLKGMANYKGDFYDQPIYAAPLQSALRFQPRTTRSGLINTAVLLNHYKPDGTQELIELNE